MDFAVLAGAASVLSAGVWGRVVAWADPVLLGFSLLLLSAGFCDGAVAAFGECAVAVDAALVLDLLLVALAFSACKQRRPMSSVAWTSGQSVPR